MKASVPRRIDRIERYAYENLVPVSDLLNLLEAMIALFRTWTDEPYAPEMVALVEFYAAPLRIGDVAELQRRHAEWQKLDDEQRLQLLRKDGGNELTNANQET